MAVYLDPAFNFIWANRAYAETCGCDPEFLTGKNHFELYPHEGNRQIFQRVVETGDPFFVSAKPFEFPNQPERGVTYWDWSLIPTKNDEGVVTGLVFTLADVTERVQAGQALRESEERLRRVLENSNDADYCRNLNTDTYEYLSPGFERLTGDPPEALQAMPIAAYVERIHPDDVAQAVDFVQRSITGEHNPYYVEYRFKHRDGDYRWFGDLFRVVTGDGDQTTYRYGSVRDITEAKRVQEALRESEDRFRTLFECAADAIFVADPETGMVIDANRKAEELIGRSREEILQLHQHELHPPEEDELSRNSFTQAVRNRGRRFTTMQVIHKDGRRIPVEISSGGIVQVAGKPIHFGIFRDISERIEAEFALRESEARYRQMFETNQAVKLIIDPADGRIVQANDAAQRFYGYDLKTLVSKRINDINTLPEGRVGEAMQRALKDQKMPFSFCHRLTSGEIRNVEVYSSPLTVSGKTLLYSIIHDVTDRYRAEEDRARLSTAIEQAAEAIVITDVSGAIQYVNPAFSSMTGYERNEVLGKNPRVLKSGRHDEAFYKNLWETIRGGEVWRGRFVNRKKDGSLYSEESVVSPVFDAQGRLANYVAVKRDISEEIALEEWLRQSQKVEALGTLAGGIAHDFNNILYAMNGYAELLRDNLEEDAGALQYVDEILECSERARDLVGRILSFSRKGGSDRRPLDFGAIVEAAARMARGAIPSTVEIAVEISEDALVVIGDESQLHQVVMNLCTNAWQAMEESGGSLDICVKPVELTEHRVAAFAGLESGSYVGLTVSDTGVGIPEDILHRIFDPFFTTKKTGEGTGLGLSVVHGVVKDHGGAIGVQSIEGEGTRFEILLPRSEMPAAERDSEHIGGALPRGTERLLLVDDEEAILGVASQILMGLGYHVTTRVSGSAALESFLESPDAFDLVITDLTMPGMKGTQLAQHILDARPEMRIILCTGYGEEIALQNVAGRGFDEVLQKPVRKRNLAIAVRRALDRSRGL